MLKHRHAMRRGRDASFAIVRSLYMGPERIGGLTPFENVTLIRSFESIFLGFESPASGYATQIMDFESSVSTFESKQHNCFELGPSSAR